MESTSQREGTTPKVFISYSHDSEDHRQRVLELANRLREYGIDCVIDQYYEDSPPPSWPRWMTEQVESAQYLLMVCTENYHRRVLGREAPGVGRGADWEGALITQEIYEDKGSVKFIPVLFTATDEQFIPIFVRATTRYDLSRSGGFWLLYRRLTNQPRITMPVLGQPLQIPPVDDEFAEIGSRLESGVDSFTEGRPTVLREAWVLLDRARSFGQERQGILQQLEGCIGAITAKDKTAEVLALQEIVQYEKDRSTETYRLHQGVRFLEEALEKYGNHLDPEELVEVEFALLRELLSLFLVGNRFPGGRFEQLEKLITRALRLLERVSSSGPLLKARCLVILGEAYKEKAMITSEPEQHAEFFTQARKYCEEAITLLESQTDDEEARYQLGMSYRHLAITYELEGDVADESGPRRALYEQWQKHSQEAARILADVGETAVRAYALLNVASSQNRLVEFPATDWREVPEILEDARKTLLEAIDLFRLVQEHRGLGWGYIHLCENTIRRLQTIPVASKTKEGLVLELERWANAAVAELKQIEDHLALGLAYENLGVALYIIYKETDDKVDVKLDRAVVALEEGIVRLEQTGFYRGLGEALLWLAQCRYALWKHSGKVSDLSNAVGALTRGLTLISIGLKTAPNLEKLYHTLESDLRAMVLG